jgi:hypothetical protein
MLERCARLHLGDVVYVLGLDDAFGSVFQELGEVVLRAAAGEDEAGGTTSVARCNDHSSRHRRHHHRTKSIRRYLQLTATEISQNLLPFRRRVGPAFVAAEVGLEFSAEDLQRG